jgi:WD40 repeat protein
MISPKHIFDDNLFEQWPAIDENNKLDLNPPEQKTAASNDFDITNKATYSIDYENGIFSCRWSPDGQYLAVGCADGGVRILRGADGKLAYRLKTSGNMPVTSMKWKPSISGVGSSSCLMTTSSSGCIDIWHVQSQKCIYSIMEDNNQVFAFDISPALNNNSRRFATAGKDKIIRIYDDDTKKLISSLEKGYLAKHVGHSNRIFALKWKYDDDNVLISGGWDNTILMWDLRSNNCFRSIFGPHIAGQSIDIQNDIICAGSWRIRDTINLFDFGTGKEIKNKINWNPSPMIYSLSFSPSLEGIIATAGTGINQLRIIDTKTGFKSKSIQLNNKKGIYCLDWDYKGELLAYAGHSNDVNIIHVKNGNSNR